MGPPYHSDAALATRLNSAHAAIGDSGDKQRLIKTLATKGVPFSRGVLEIDGGDATRPNSAVTTTIPGPSDKPAIAVLPFQNLSDDPGQEYFADGLVDDITTALSRFRALFVIARNSRFTYKGKPVEIKQVGHQLGVRYVLEGSVRKAGTRLRITGQFIDVAIGAHIWADRLRASGRYFRSAGQGDAAGGRRSCPELDRAEMERASRRPSGNIDAVTAYYRGLPHTEFPTNPENNDAAMRDFKNAIALDPGFAPAYGGAATCLDGDGPTDGRETSPRTVPSSCGLPIG